ncbi:hypothetical protein PSI9734_01619 [Pseudidiomarina piscicola]|uniref:Polysaccharide pyruvyl transferase domain-containing protein n=1 Tax=Pseudidiomarina piscicola TaxID=2614830 RepID=A0A6S6WME0_9GAMM|nr:polysaccharide pyruvyl transferase family protein [Pseudidiomarina piscicola]CAB0151206.1 hypothetical protein PSI9734_01619 [Pseudidiomarina piscicola]VZT40712.1 hypothetical protein PSI9734_01619 [Pseudomonas aeruginosa]
MNILVIGQCTLHWGRMEFGNIGNFYIMEPFFRELHKTFDNAKIKTTMQFSDRFQSDEKVESLPLEHYYAWRDNELELVQREIEISEGFKSTGALSETTLFLDAVQWADLVIDFSGDIWGDNANFLGQDRFEVGLLKDQVVKNLGKPLVMLAGSPGPFTNERTKELAKSVYKQFDLVTNREPISTDLLESWGFDVSRTHSLACPAFMFEPASGDKVKKLLAKEGLDKVARTKPVVGFILCGWNFESGPFDKWPRGDEEYTVFAEAVEYITETLGASVCLMSHSNGFDVPPAPFELKHGRDYPIMKQLEHVLMERAISKDFFMLNDVYDAWETKAIVASFDMLVSGRIHAAVAGLSQHVPTVIIDYGHEPKAHKLMGFATVAGAQEYVSDPCDVNDLKEKVAKCWGNLDDYRARLIVDIPKVHELGRKNFKLAKDVL